jgi:hypothetical protein
MPSLIYITRIRPLPVELAQALASSGSHVKSFGPGEITADECILVMTSEAILAGLRVPGLAPVHGRAGAQSPQPQATPPLHDVHKHLGAEAAVWSSIKAAELVESAAGESEGPPGLPSSVQTVGRADDDPGVVPSQTVSRVLASAQQNASAAPQVLPAAREPAARENDRGSEHSPGASILPVPSNGKAPRVAFQLSTLLLKKTGLWGRIHSANGHRLRRFWQPEAVAAALLVLALVLLAGRLSIFPSKAEVATTDHATQASNRPETSSNPPNLPEATPHKSGDDFVAEDYTTRFELQGHRRSARQSPDPKPEAQNRPIPKRIVDN